ncbi:putative ATP-dependent RNA helicase [Trichinella spiralis]|uniref:ATP-dependent RNA helicase n=1 Tax=Trichinella spiralis TaxID=6334 RepID=A0ABR3KJ86_TRISP
MEKNTAESVDELNKKSMNQMACADMKHETNKGSEIEENDYDAQGALKEVLPNEEQNFDKEEGIEEASLIIAVDVDSKNINESDAVSGEQRHVEMANSIEESASLLGSSITADGMSSTSDVDSNSNSGDVGIVENEHLDREKRLGPLKFVDEDSESLKGEEVRKASQEVAIIEAEEVFEKASWSIDISENSTSNSVIDDSVPTYSQNFGISICEYLSGNSQIRENSFLDFGSQTAESSEDATTASEWILIEEKASEGDEDGKHDSTDVRTVEAQYVQEMKVSEEATTMIANCQNEKSAKKANAASEKLGIAEENASDNPNVLVRNLWLIYILLSYAINYAFVVIIFFLCLRIMNDWLTFLMFSMNILLWLNEDLHFQK